MKKSSIILEVATNIATQITKKLTNVPRITPKQFKHLQFSHPWHHR